MWQTSRQVKTATAALMHSVALLKNVRSRTYCPYEMYTTVNNLYIPHIHTTEADKMRQAIVRQKSNRSTSSMLRNSTPSSFGLETGQRLPWRAFRVATACSTVSYCSITIAHQYISTWPWCILDLLHVCITTTTTTITIIIIVIDSETYRWKSTTYLQLKTLINDYILLKMI